MATKISVDGTLKQGKLPDSSAAGLESNDEACLAFENPACIDRQSSHGDVEVKIQESEHAR